MQPGPRNPVQSPDELIHPGLVASVLLPRYMGGPHFHFINQKNRNMESYVVTRQIFAVGKRDAFHIQLEYHYETQKVIVTSSLPDWVLDEHPFPELTINEKPPYLSMIEVNQKLTEYAHTLKRDAVARKFFYSHLFLNEKGEFVQNKSLYYRQTLSKFLCDKIPYVSVIRKPYTTLYLTHCFRSAICKESEFLKVKSIKRKTFETHIQESSQKDEYTELYYRLKSFVYVNVIDLRANMPSFYAGIDEKGEILIAFVQHSLQLTNE